MGFPGVISSLSVLITGFRSHLVSYPDAPCMLQFWLKFMVQGREMFHTWSIWATFPQLPENRPPKFPPSFGPVRLSQEALNTEPVALVDAKVRGGFLGPL